MKLSRVKFVGYSDRLCTSFLIEQTGIILGALYLEFDDPAVHLTYINTAITINNLC